MSKIEEIVLELDVVYMKKDGKKISLYEKSGSSNHLEVAETSSNSGLGFDFVGQLAGINSIE